MINKYYDEIKIINITYFVSNEMNFNKAFNKFNGFQNNINELFFILNSNIIFKK